MQRRLTFVADDADAGLSLSEAILRRCPELPRRRARMMVELGAARIAGAPAAVEANLASGQHVEVLRGGALERAAERAAAGVALVSPPAPGDPTSVAVVHEDGDLWVIDKPAGLATESVTPTRASLAALLARRGPAGRVWVVQRLDEATSGLLVVAKNADANRALSRAAAEHRFERVYAAVVRGAFPDDLALLDAPLRGRRARTRVAVVERFGHLATRLACRLETGRTHQIRLHCARAGHPLLGDPRHGQRTAWEPPRMALHAARLGFRHPRTDEPLCFDSPVPQELASWLAELAALVREASATL